MPGLVQDMATVDGGPSAGLTRLCIVVESTGSMAGTWPGLRCVRSSAVRCSVRLAVQMLSFVTYTHILGRAASECPLRIGYGAVVAPIECRQRRPEPCIAIAAQWRVHLIQWLMQPEQQVSLMD